MNAQRESTSLHDLNEKLEQELRHKEAQLKVRTHFKSLNWLWLLLAWANSVVVLTTIHF